MSGFNRIVRSRILNIFACERKGRVKDDSRIFDLSNWKEGWGGSWVEWVFWERSGVHLGTFSNLK